MRKETFTVHGAKVTFTEVVGVFNGDELNAILIHDENDINHEGDSITSDYCGFPETDEEARLICDYSITTWNFTVENGKYNVSDKYIVNG